MTGAGADDLRHLLGGLGEDDGVGRLRRQPCQLARMLLAHGQAFAHAAFEAWPQSLERRLGSGAHGRAAFARALDGMSVHGVSDHGENIEY